MIPRLRLDVFQWGNGTLTIQTDDGKGHGTRIAGPKLVLGEARCIGETWIDEIAVHQMLAELERQRGISGDLGGSRGIS